MKTRDIIVMGASTGGITALKEFVKHLPKDFEGSVFIVLHIPSYSESELPGILSKAGPLPAVHPEDGDSIEPGKIYIAPNDRHLIIEKDKVRVKKGPKENRARPAIDALFRSAAYIYKSRVIGIIFSGLLDDGVSGLYTIKQLGGIAIVQDPKEAEQPQLPLNVMEYVKPDYIACAADMVPIVCGMVKEPAPANNKFSKKELKLLEMEVIIATKDDSFHMGIMDMGEFTPFTCPDCHGAFIQLVENNIIRYRCHTGHAFTANSLLAEVSESVESMLWQSMRGLEEMTMLLNRIGDVYKKTLKKPGDAAFFHTKAEENEKRARIIHDSVFKQEQYSEDLRLVNRKE